MYFVNNFVANKKPLFSHEIGTQNYFKDLEFARYLL